MSGADTFEHAGSGRSRRTDGEVAGGLAEGVAPEEDEREDESGNAVEDEAELEEEEDEEEDDDDAPAVDPATLADWCSRCGGRCCKYYTVLIDEPEDADDYDELRWFLAHEHCYIYVDEEQWHINVESRCRFLGDDGRCGIYEHRPDVCRDFGHDEECEFTGEYDFEHTFRTLRDLEEYAREALPAEEFAKLRTFPPGWKGPV